MRAAWYERTGPAREVLIVGELPDPMPAAGEVLVQVNTSGVNPADIKKRSGWGGPGRLEAGVVVPGDDGAGLILDVGSGVAKSRLGERVWIYGARVQGSRGTAAALVTVPAPQAVPLPDAISFTDGAALGIPAMTAHRALFWDAAPSALAGQTVLVTGAAGSVGL